MQCVRVTISFALIQILEGQKYSMLPFKTCSSKNVLIQVQYTAVLDKLL